MIARLWHGVVPAEKADRYLHLMRTVAIPDYKATAGNLDALCLSRGEGRVVHFEMLTFWENAEAIKRFAGDDYEVAKYYEFDSEYLLEKEPNVRHFDAYRG